jgi:DNA-binding Lrp family transcriptional regulator
MNYEDRLVRFVGEQDNLDAIYCLMKGMSYREVGEKIGRPHSFVQRVNAFLKDHGLTTGRQWRVDVNALNMTKTFRFYDFRNGKPEEVIRNDDFLTYFADVKKSKLQYFAMYTFPNEVDEKIGEEISPYYIYVPKFKAPLYESEISLYEFEDARQRHDNTNPLPPRGGPINPDIIHIAIAQYVEIFGAPESQGYSIMPMEKTQETGLSEVNLSNLAEVIKDDMKAEGLAEAVDVTYDIVRNRYNEMLEKHIIYPGFGLEMRRLGYTLSFVWISTNEIYRIMKAFGEFNIVSGLAYTKEDRYLLHLQYPRNKETEIFYILSSIDNQNEVFEVLKVHNNRAVPHPYYFEKEKRKRRKELH